MIRAKKVLGQHWLTDEKTLKTICDSADLRPNDTVLEIGPGLGSLTRHLVGRVKRVIAVELDESLAARLPQAVPAPNLEVLQADILKFNFNRLPSGYKVVANIPYYLTSRLLRVLLESSRPPASIALLVQKEVAERICAKPGKMSILAVSMQIFYECQLGLIVPAKLFKPPPKVDSQIVLLNRRPKPLISKADTDKFFKIVKAGFCEKRKKLRNSLAKGLKIKKEDAEQLLRAAKIGKDSRAEELTIADWYKILVSAPPKMLD